MNNKKKIAVVAMSGGVDSSVTALILQKQGYEVVGLTGKMVDTPAAEEVIKNAKVVAEKLGIKLYVYDAVTIFQKHVIEYFEQTYKSGKTPNPCIMCNKFVKWGELFDYAINDLGADVFATGHYAQIKLEKDVYKLYPAQDENKDQLYFLYKLTQSQLAKTIFPLSNYVKSDVRKLAEDFDLPPKSSKESQDICFIQKPLTAKKYLIDKFGTKKGDFLDILTGKKWGEHEGCYQYTVGQRKGIGITAPYPLYVIDINADKNIVYVGREEDNYKTSLRLVDTNFGHVPEKKEFDAMVKIRYNMSAKPARVKVYDEFTEVIFKEPVSSVTEGQAGVIYDLSDGHLIGGGTVCKS